MPAAEPVSGCISWRFGRISDGTPPPHHRIRTNNQGEFHGSGLIPRGTPIGKRTHGVTWLSARCSYPGRNPCPWRDPYRGIHKGGRPPKAAAPLCGGGAKRRLLYMGLSLGTGSCLWDARPAMCRFAYGFLPGYEHRALSHGPPCVRFPMGVLLGMSPEPSNSHLVLYDGI